MHYLLDTNVISEFVKPNADPRVLACCEALPREQVYLSLLTLAEICQGIERLPASKKRVLLAAWLDNRILPAYRDRILSIDLETARAWGAMTAQMFRRGQSVSFSDTMIAATAIRHGLTMVTRNVEHFRPTGVLLLNPWTDSPPHPPTPPTRT